MEKAKSVGLGVASEMVRGKDQDSESRKTSSQGIGSLILRKMFNSRYFKVRIWPAILATWETESRRFMV
jgi:hypothetical protein